MTIDEILQDVGLKYEDLTAEEKSTLDKWMTSLTQSVVSVENVRDYIKQMRDAVETELTQTGHGSEQDYLLKARLRNYMLLEAFLSTPERAKKAIERAKAGVIPRK